MVKLIATDDAMEVDTSYQEEAIISLLIDFPDFFSSVASFLEPKFFNKVEVQYVLANIKNRFNDTGYVPTRELLHDIIAQQLTVDDPYEEVLRIVNRRSNPRDVPFLKEKLRVWAEKKAYGLLYTPEAIQAYESGDLDHLRQIFMDANKIADVGHKGFWFFEQLDELFEIKQERKISTGFGRLDEFINFSRSPNGRSQGGPSRGDVLLWMAATNVGKSIMLANNAVSAIKSGHNTLFVTFELSALRTAFRCLGALTRLKLDDAYAHKETFINNAMRVFNTHHSHLVIYELPPSECSVNHLYAICESLRRTRGWRPDVVCLDYLDLMKSRESAYNVKMYDRQKEVATELRGLAKNEDVVVFTATQTNRSGVASENGNPIDLDQAAESYGKMMPLPYVISLNQTGAQRDNNPPLIDLFIAKNTNGPKHGTVTCSIEYDKMLITEAL